MDAIDNIWQSFLREKGLRGDDPLPEGTDTRAFYRDWERHLFKSGSPARVGGRGAGAEPTSEATKGVVFYADDWFEGSSWGPFGPGEYPKIESTTVANDQVSSIRVPPGWVVEMYEHTAFGGNKFVISGDAPAVGGYLNDQLSSFKIRAPGAQGLRVNTGRRGKWSGR